MPIKFMKDSMHGLEAYRFQYLNDTQKKPLKMILCFNAVRVLQYDLLSLWKVLHFQPFLQLTEGYHSEFPYPTMPVVAIVSIKVILSWYVTLLWVRACLQILRETIICLLLNAGSLMI